LGLAVFPDFAGAAFFFSAIIDLSFTSFDR
jgi:hypothetical protein